MTPTRLAPSPSSKRSTATRSGSSRPGPSRSSCAAAPTWPAWARSDRSRSSRRAPSAPTCAVSRRPRAPPLWPGCARPSGRSATPLPCCAARPDELTAAVQRKLDDLKELDARLRAAEQAALVGQAAAWPRPQSTGGWSPGSTDSAPINCASWPTRCARSGGLQTVVLGGSPDGSRAALVALAAKGDRLSAPELISDAARTVGGGGGGKNPEQAMAGGKDAAAWTRPSIRSGPGSARDPRRPDGCWGSISGPAASVWP